MDTAKIEAGVRLILEGVGEDPEREGLRETPARVARMYEEVLGGLEEDPSRHFDVTFDEGHEEIVLVGDIPFFSMCEHHLAPFFGKAHVAYIPGEDGRIKEKRKISLFPRKTVRVKVGKALDIASLVEDASPDAKHTRTELGVVTDAMLDAITAELEQIRGEKAPEGRWNPRTKRREAPGTPSGPVGGALGEPDEK
mgnify:CR=1 FL=1